MVFKHLLGLAVCGAALGAGQRAAGDPKVERGRYLTLEVGKCLESPEAIVAHLKTLP